MCALEIQAQRLILVEQPVSCELVFELRLLILQQLAVNQSLLANVAHGKRWRTGEAAAAMPA
jgi:hypothetical protein